MKCKIFFGLWYEAQDAFNAWAKGKALTRDVLIHEQLMWTAGEPKTPCLLIIVYHPEDPQWDTTETLPKPPQKSTYQYDSETQKSVLIQ